MGVHVDDFDSAAANGNFPPRGRRGRTALQGGFGALMIPQGFGLMKEVFDDETEAVNSFFPEREIRRFDILSFVQELKENK